MAKDKKGAFRITIVDNGTGKVLADEETDCIIGAANVAGEGKTCKFSFFRSERRKPFVRFAWC